MCWNQLRSISPEAQSRVGLGVVGEFNDFDVDSLCLSDLDELVVGGVGAYYADFDDVVAG